MDHFTGGALCLLHMILYHTTVGCVVHTAPPVTWNIVLYSIEQSELDLSW